MKLDNFKIKELCFIDTDNTSFVYLPLQIHKAIRVISGIKYSLGTMSPYDLHLDSKIVNQFYKIRLRIPSEEVKKGYIKYIFSFPEVVRP